MILQYFKNKENKEKNIAFEQYKIIINSSKNILNGNYNNFILEKNYNISFEIITILLILYIQNNLNQKNKNSFIEVNNELISIFISDLDKSFREIGVGDMSIGKYVKSYVKKFYFRLKIFPKLYDHNKDDSLCIYLTKLNFIKKNYHISFSKIINNEIKELLS